MFIRAWKPPWRAPSKTASSPQGLSVFKGCLSRGCPGRERRATRVPAVAPRPRPRTSRTKPSTTCTSTPGHPHPLRHAGSGRSVAVELHGARRRRQPQCRHQRFPRTHRAADNGAGRRLGDQHSHTAPDVSRPKVNPSGRLCFVLVSSRIKLTRAAAKRTAGLSMSSVTVRAN